MDMEASDIGMIVSGALVVLLVGLIGAVTGNTHAALLGVAAACVAWLTNVAMACNWPSPIVLGLAGATVLLTAAGVVALAIA